MSHRNLVPILSAVIGVLLMALLGVGSLLLRQRQDAQRTERAATIPAASPTTAPVAPAAPVPAPAALPPSRSERAPIPAPPAYTGGTQPTTTINRAPRSPVAPPTSAPSGMASVAEFQAFVRWVESSIAEMARTNQAIQAIDEEAIAAHHAAMARGDLAAAANNERSTTQIEAVTQAMLHRIASTRPTIHPELIPAAQSFTAALRGEVYTLVRIRRSPYTSASPQVQAWQAEGLRLRRQADIEIANAFVRRGLRPTVSLSGNDQHGPN